MTNTPEGSPAAPAAPGAASARAGRRRAGDEILVAYPRPARQARLTVLARLLLAIPHLLVLVVLGVATQAVLVITWFAALFTGRVPDGLAEFLCDYLRLGARVYAYLFLLTDDYPPFTLGDADHPVAVGLAPARLNRLAVLFRLVLAIPAAIVTALLSIGIVPIMLAVWLIALIAGRVPGASHQALAAAHRYLTRWVGYTHLLTGTYPKGLFGDRRAAGAGSAAAGGAASAADGSLAVAGSPADGSLAAAASASDGSLAVGGSPADGSLAVAGSPAAGSAAAAAEPGEGGLPPPSGGALPWRLTLSGGARALVVLVLAAGALAIAGGAVGVAALASGSNSPVTRAEAITAVASAHDMLARQLASLEQQAGACRTSADPLACVTARERQVSQDFGAFAAALRGARMPSDAAGPADALRSDAIRAQQICGQLALATSVSQFEQTIRSSGLVSVLNKFDGDYQRLASALTP